MNPEIFDAHPAYDEELRPLVEALAAACARLDVPLLIAACVARTSAGHVNMVVTTNVVAQRTPAPLVLATLMANGGMKPGAAMLRPAKTAKTA